MKLPKTCKAAVLTEYGKPLEIQEIPMRTELENGAILTKVLLAGICGTDLHQTKGTLGIKMPLPQIPGHEVLARIVALGNGRTHDVAGNELKVGDRIMWAHVMYHAVSVITARSSVNLICAIIQMATACVLLMSSVEALPNMNM